MSRYNLGLSEIELEVLWEAVYISSMHYSNERYRAINNRAPHTYVEKMKEYHRQAVILLKRIEEMMEGNDE